MACDVVCLRPEADFLRVGVIPPTSLRVSYRSHADPDVASLLAAARGLVIPAVGPKLSPTLFERSTLELVQVTGSGVDRLDEPLLRRLGIPVANVPGGSNAAVAEYVVAATSMLLRRLAWGDYEIRAGRYEEFRAKAVAANLRGLHGLTVGIIGLGTIGRAVAALLRAYDCEILYYDPSPGARASADALGATSVTLDVLLARSDVVTLHLPLTPSTSDLIGAERLAQMKPGAVLINAARGGIVDERALAEALGSGHLGGAALDVHAVEPPHASNPLFSLEGEAARRLLFTPHLAGVTRQSSTLLFRSAWANVERVLLHRLSPLHRVF